MPTNPKQAAELENASENGALLQELTRVLQSHGFDNLEIVSFSVAATEDSMRALHGTPCPIKCRRLPGGIIRCEPEC